MSDVNIVSLQSEEIPHIINIFNVYNRYRVLKFSCENCKMRKDCIVSFKKKTECIVAEKLNTWLQPFLVGRCDTFASDDFYVNISNRLRKDRTLECIQKVQRQFGA